MRMRIYKSNVMKGGRRVVQSGSLSEWFAFDIIKWVFKAIFFCMFFWIIIPVKLFTK